MLSFFNTFVDETPIYIDELLLFIPNRLEFYCWLINDKLDRLLILIREDFLRKLVDEYPWLWLLFTDYCSICCFLFIYEWFFFYLLLTGFIVEIRFYFDLLAGCCYCCLLDSAFCCFCLLIHGPICFFDLSLSFIVFLFYFISNTSSPCDIAISSYTLLLFMNSPPVLDICVFVFIISISY